jgi:hypothetical protein
VITAVHAANSGGVRSRPARTGVSAALSPHCAVVDPTRLAAIDGYGLTGQDADPDLDRSHLS